MTPAHCASCAPPWPRWSPSGKAIGGGRLSGSDDEEALGPDPDPLPREGVYRDPAPRPVIPATGAALRAIVHDLEASARADVLALHDLTTHRRMGGLPVSRTMIDHEGREVALEPEDYSFLLNAEALDLQAGVDTIPLRACGRCGAPLSGHQTKWCSAACNIAAFQQRAAAANAV